MIWLSDENYVCYGQLCLFSNEHLVNKISLFKVYSNHDKSGFRIFTIRGLFEEQKYNFMK